MARPPSSNALRSRLAPLTIGCMALMVLVLTTCATNSGAWERIQEAGVLRVGMDASFPPFEMVGSDGVLAGFDVDLARELGRRLGLEIEFVANLPYDGLYDALAVGRVDMVVSALVVNPDKTGDVAYSMPYFDAGQVLVVARDTESINELADLTGRTVAVEFGSLGDETARSHARQTGTLTVVPCETARDALALVAAGGADAALVDHVSALAEGAGAGPAGGIQDPSLTIAGEPLVAEPYAVAVHAHNRALLRAVNRALKAMQADGTLDALVAEWISGSSSPGSTALQTYAPMPDALRRSVEWRPGPSVV